MADELTNATPPSRSETWIKPFVEWLRYRLPWLAGANTAHLRSLPGEKPFHDRLGALVLLVTGLNAVAMCYLASVVHRQPMTKVWFVGVIWWLLLLVIEPLLLDVGTSGLRGLVNVVPLRLIVSIVIAGLFSEAILVGVFKGEIQNQLGKHDLALVEQVQTRSFRNYEGRILVARSEISSIQSRDQKLQDKVNYFDRMAACETNEPSCSHTHIPTCENWCHYYQHQAAKFRNELNQNLRPDRAQVRTLNKEIGQWQEAEQVIPKTRQHQLTEAHGLIEREQALWKIETHSGVAAVEIWALRSALLTLDVLALALKLAHMGTSSYKKYASAARRHEGTVAYQLQKTTDVLQERIRLQADADMEVDRARIEGQRDRRIAEEEAKWSEWSRPTRRSRESLQAEPFGSYADRSRRHDQIAIDVPRALRLAGWVGTALVGGLSVLLGLYSWKTGSVIPGEWITVTALLGAVGLAGYTHGFRSAPPWALRATFANLLMGLLLPVALLTLNL